MLSGVHCGIDWVGRWGEQLLEFEDGEIGDLRIYLVLFYNLAYYVNFFIVKIY